MGGYHWDERICRTDWFGKSDQIGLRTPCARRALDWTATCSVGRRFVRVKRSMRASRSESVLRTFRRWAPLASLCSNRVYAVYQFRGIGGDRFLRVSGRSRTLGILHRVDFRRLAVRATEATTIASAQSGGQALGRMNLLDGSVVAHLRTQRLEQVGRHLTYEHLRRCRKVHSPIEGAKLLTDGRITQQGFVNACMVHFRNQPDVRTKGTGS
jgi:hypothetical protein